MTLLDQERATYEEMWAVPGYSEQSPGELLLPLFLNMAKPGSRGTVLDAGCGAGRGAIALAAAGFSVTCCDITSAGMGPDTALLPYHDAPLWSDLKRKIGFRDWVYCCDVLEHIPPTFTMLVVQRLLDVARKGVFLSIGLEPDNFGVMVGRPLHQSIQSFVAWRDQLSVLAEMVEARDLLTNGVYLIEPR